MSSSSRDPFSLIFAEDLTCEGDLLEVIVRKFEKQSYGSIGRYFVAKDEQAPFEFRFAQIPNFYSGMMMSGILGGFCQLSGLLNSRCRISQFTCTS